MNPLLVLAIVWLFASCVLASVAFASKMSFFAWFCVGIFSPLLLVVLAAEYFLANLPGRHKTALLER